VPGLGTLWSNADTGSVGGRALVRWLVRWLVAGGACMVFENHEDPKELGFEPDAANVTVIAGSGVDPAAFQPTPEPSAPPVKFAVVSRMLRTKGIAEAVAATRLVRAEGAAIELHLFGTPDLGNRDSCTEAELRAWSAEPGIHWHGRTDNVAQVWRDHHVAMLLTTYREGMPRALAEAAAAGRPIITTDVPGCREIVRDGIEGFLVAPRQSEAAAVALRRLATDQPLRRRMGDAAHARFRQGFTEADVREKIGGLYRALASTATRSPQS